MRVFNGIEEAKGIKNPVVTTGSFDGVHIGHKVIIKRINALAKEVDGESVLITFSPHPRKVLYPEYKDLQLIASHEEKIEMLRQTGIDNVIIMEFTKEFAHTSSVDFVKNYLVKKLGVKKVVIGFNHHFGHNKEGDFDHLKNMGLEYGYEVEKIPEQDIQNETVSSSKIRESISTGQIQKANAYLDHYYIMIGTINASIMPYEQFGFPTQSIKIEEESKLIPLTGTYAVTVNYQWNHYKALAIIDNCQKPGYINCGNISVALSMLDEKNLHGKRVTITFHKRIGSFQPKADQQVISKELTKALLDLEELIY